MPELPEVEVVRRGVDRWSVGRVVDQVQICHPRAIRRHAGGGGDLIDRLLGATITATDRRGKYFWLVLDTGELLVVHLGMSGQLLVQPSTSNDEAHLRVRLSFADDGPELRFVDQRTFGGIFLDVPQDGPARADQRPVPSLISHIGLDPFDPLFSPTAVTRAIRRRSAPIKAVILDQSVVSGIGNIYADESLWRAKLNWSIPANQVSGPRVRALLGHAEDVMADSLAVGGTSFDSLYVDVNGSSGHFSRSLAVYGQEDRPCPRCGTPIIRECFANRSSFRCPKCQQPAAASQC